MTTFPVATSSLSLQHVSASKSFIRRCPLHWSVHKKFTFPHAYNALMISWFIFATNKLHLSCDLWQSFAKHILIPLPKSLPFKFLSKLTCFAMSYNLSVWRRSVKCINLWKHHHWLVFCLIPKRFPSVTSARKHATVLKWNTLVWYTTCTIMYWYERSFNLKTFSIL